MSAHARRRSAAKRSPLASAIPFDDSAYGVFDRGPDVAKLDDALTALGKLDSTQARIVELRYFGGLSVAEVSLYLGVSERTVIRQWGLAKVWLAEQLGDAQADAGPRRGGSL